jgi:xylulokinase
VNKFLLVQDFLVQRLTGLFVTNASIACTSLYFDFIHNSWWQPMLDAIGISAGQLPEIAQPGEVVGELLPAVAQGLGLSPTLKVVACGMDQCTGAIGAGNIFPGCCSETTGAALTIQVSVPNADIDKNKIIPVYAHSIPGQYLLVPVCPTAGMAYKWFRDVFCQPEIEQAAMDGLDSYDLITRLAAPIPAGSDGLLLLPHLMGAYSPSPNTAARGSFTGFTLTHTRGHFARAVLEGVAFLLKLNLEVILSTGLEIREIRSTGGGSRSALWNQIKANVCNLPVVSLINEDTALIGDAVLAGVACGGFESIAQGCQVMLDLKDRFIPDSDALAYEESYRRYCDLDITLADYYKRNF